MQKLITILIESLLDLLSTQESIDLIETMLDDQNLKMNYNDRVYLQTTLATLKQETV